MRNYHCQLMEQFELLKYKKAFGYEDRNAGMKILTELIDIDKIEGGTSGYLMMNDNPDEFYVKPYEILFPEGLRKEDLKR